MLSRSVSMRKVASPFMLTLRESMPPGTGGGPGERETSRSRSATLHGLSMGTTAHPGRHRAGSAMPDESEPRRNVCMAPLAPLAMAASAGVVLDRFLEPWGTLTWAILALAGAG